MVHMDLMQELMTTKELAEFLRLNEKKVYQLIREVGIPHVKIAGKWLFPREHIMRWIDERVQRENDICIAGSDDILLARMLAHYSRDTFPRSFTCYSPIGSLKGIQALAMSKCQACCVHLLDLGTGEYNLPFLHRHLAARRYIVVNLWYRTQGLIVKKGNPLGIREVEDVAKKDLRFINRNDGSGTRILFEYLLREEGYDPAGIKGFDNTVDSHLEVVQKILFDEADVGIGIEYPTHTLPLDFIPLLEERFDLVIPREIWPTKVIQDFIAYINPVQIHGLFTNLPGYDLKDCGKILFESK